MVSTLQESLNDLRKGTATDHHDWLSATTASPVTGSYSACSYNFCPGAQAVFHKLGVNYSKSQPGNFLALGECHKYVGKERK